jgi:hypothetical protein
MAKSTLADLQKALERGSNTSAAAGRPEPVTQPGGYRAPSRANKTPITAYLPLDFKTSLRLIQARENRSIQALISEALNDLFAKYQVPTVSE